mgnify:CR=1 FL=1
MRKFGIVILCVVFFAMPALAEGNEAGSVKNAEGGAYIIRDGQEMSAEPGMRVFEKDMIRTDSDGSMGVILRDDTVLSFGPGTEVELATFLFNPIDEDYGLYLRMFKGTASFLSGSIGHLSPESVQVETPDAVLGLKGTHFLIEVR